MTTKPNKKQEKEPPERFYVEVPHELWVKIEPLMKKTFLKKTSFTLQALNMLVESHTQQANYKM